MLKVVLCRSYEFICAPIVHQRYRQEFWHGKAKGRAEPFTRPDLSLSSQDWGNLVVGRISSWVDMDSPLDNVRRDAEKVLEQEFAYSGHLGLPSILLSLRSVNSQNLARFVYSKILPASQKLIWVHVPLHAPELVAQKLMASSLDEEDDQELPADLDTWEWWSRFHRSCDSDKKLSLVLELNSADLPSHTQMMRWLGEPLAAVVLPTHIFMTNKHGCPVLSRPHQAFVNLLYRLDIQVMIKGCDRHNNLRYYQQYMEHLWNSQPPDDPLTRFARGFEDFLQVPLQPLMDNLESSTYEIFEKDPIKYSKYQEAIHRALEDRVPVERRGDTVVTVMVVGAGRGPLVRATLIASEICGVNVRVYAVEKNPNAIVTLYSEKRDYWGSKVTVVACDMREWDPPEKADILVSELLDPLETTNFPQSASMEPRSVVTEDGISIPASYTSYICPIQSPKLYGDISTMRDKDKHPMSNFEMPYVVRLHNHTQLCEPQALFTFHHPNREPVIDNNRYKSAQFTASFKCTIHGFAGYFDTQLYKDVQLSILPSTHSPGMFSWFPIFFPLREPVYVRQGEVVTANFWRLATHRKVWYEWNISSPLVVPIHNPTGRSYTIGL
ncbi:PRMT5 [Cordylochernes scorpioides]|uniref:Protein arginine N-methyltransferase n=1 Tax=Cordylochernes scorpioides TaxID=51811 RepID=A0ABY6L0F2_9ARAC|nr:PRMT5 [Cordylochernes scorpioides]